MSKRISLLLTAVAALPVLFASGCSSRRAYPARPVTLVCPWSPGGGTDRVSRQFAVQLEQELGVPVNVVNATGGGGVTGHTRGALARPDGYTLTMATVELNMLHWRGLTTVAYHDFEPLALLNRDDAAVFVRMEAPWKTIAELEGTIRERPGELRAAGTAQGGVWHIALAGWLVARNVAPDAVTWISINGAGPSLQELMANGVDLVCCSVPEARSLTEGGLVRCLGVMADARLSPAPDVPTFREMGIDWALGGWRGLVFPKGVPPDRLARMQEAVRKVSRGEEFAAFMQSAGFHLTVAPPAEFAALLGDMDRCFGDILTSPAFARVSQSPVSPMAFPGLVIAIGLIALGFLAGRGHLRLPPDKPPLGKEHLVRLICAPVAIVFFVIAADTIGFVLAAGAMLVALLLDLRVRPARALLATALLVPALYHAFAVVLGVPLPWGWLGW